MRNYGLSARDSHASHIDYPAPYRATGGERDPEISSADREFAAAIFVALCAAFPVGIFVFATAFFLLIYPHS
jgi:hypothetical protein